MVRRIRLAKKADFRLDEILVYLETEFGKKVAETFLLRTYSFFDVVAEFPKIGFVEDSERKIYAFVIEKQVTVFYRFTKKEIIILDFFDTRMNPKQRGR